MHKLLVECLPIFVSDPNFDYELKALIDLTSGQRDEFAKYEVEGLTRWAGFNSIVRSKFLLRCADHEFAELFVQHAKAGGVSNLPDFFNIVFLNGRDNPSNEEAQLLADLCDHYQDLVALIADFPPEHPFFTQLALIPNKYILIQIYAIIREPIPDLARRIYPENRSNLNVLHTTIVVISENPVYDQSVGFELFERYLDFDQPDTEYLLNGEFLRREMISQLASGRFTIPEKWRSSFCQMLASYFYHNWDELDIKQLIDDLAGDEDSLNEVRKNLNQVYMVGLKEIRQVDLNGRILAYCRTLQYLDSNGRLVKPEYRDIVIQLLMTQFDKINKWVELSILLGFSDSGSALPPETYKDLIYRYVVNKVGGRSPMWNNEPIYMWDYVPFELYGADEVAHMRAVVADGRIGVDAEKHLRRFDQMLTSTQLTAIFSQSVFIDQVGVVNPKNVDKKVEDINKKNEIRYEKEVDEYNEALALIPMINFPRPDGRGFNSLKS